jgi:heat shock protein HslJ
VLTRSRIAAVALALAAFAGCGDEDVVDPSAVTGVAWRLESLQRADFSVVRPELGRYTLQLEADLSLRVRSDCNSCGGTYTLSGESFTVSPLTCTRVFCGETSLDQEYVRALQAAQSLDEDDDRLTVLAAGQTLRYVR